jgi:hypothetical protein
MYPWSATLVFTAVLTMVRPAFQPDNNRADMSQDCRGQAGKPDLRMVSMTHSQNKLS